MFHYNPVIINGWIYKSDKIINKFNNSTGYFIYEMCKFLKIQQPETSFYETENGFQSKVKSIIINSENEKIKISAISIEKLTKDEAKHEANIDWIKQVYELLNYNHKEFKIIKEHFNQQQKQYKRIHEKVNNKSQKVLQTIENKNEIETIYPQKSSIKDHTKKELYHVYIQFKSNTKQKILKKFQIQ